MGKAILIMTAARIPAFALCQKMMSYVIFVTASEDGIRMKALPKELRDDFTAIYLAARHRHEELVYKGGMDSRQEETEKD